MGVLEEFLWILISVLWFLFWDNWVSSVLEGNNLLFAWIYLIQIVMVWYRKEFCLNEVHLFGVLFGTWIGLCESWEYFFTERRLLKIPHVQQQIKVAIRSNISSLLKTSVLVSSKRYLAYIVLYFLFGGSVQSYVLSVTRLGIGESPNSVFELIHPTLAFRCIIIGSACIYTFRLSNLLFLLFMVKVCFFIMIENAIPVITNVLNI